MGLTTHVLDLTHGRPAAGLKVELFSETGAGGEPLAAIRTTADGRGEGPLLDGASFAAGRYRLAFHVADYFRAAGVDLPDPPFLDIVSVSFGVSDPGSHHHVPLLVSPYGYSTYRGS